MGKDVGMRGTGSGAGLQTRTGILRWCAGCLAMALFYWAGAAAAEPRALVVGVPPYYEPGRLVEVAKPFQGYLQDRLGVPVRVYTRPSYRAFLAAAERGEFDLTVAMPHLARYLELRADYRPAVGVRGVDPIDIVFQAGDGLERLAARDRVRIAVSDPLSVQAALLPEWAERALPGVRVEVVDALSEPNSLQVVLAGQADAALVAGRAVEVAGGDLRVRLTVLDSGLRRDFLQVFSVRRDLEPDLAEALDQALLGLAESPARALFRLDKPSSALIVEPELQRWDPVLRGLGLLEESL